MLCLPLALAGVLFSALPPAEPPAGASRAQAYLHFLLAKRAVAENDYARAIDQFAVARNLDPESPVVRVELAEVYFRLRRYKDAAREAEKAAELDSGHEAALDLLAQIYEATGETERALMALRRLADLSPGQAAYLVRMAALQDRAGRPEEAVRLLEEAVARDPRASDALFELVERFQGQGRLDRAIETLERAAQADPENLYVRSKLAEFFLQIRDEKRARQALDAMVAAQPHNLQVLVEVARAYRQIDDDERAARLYRRALLLRPDDEGLRVNYATALTRAGRYREALAEYRRLLAGLDPQAEPGRGGERFEFLKRIGLIELELGNPRAAAEALGAARSLPGGEDVDFVRVHARALELSGEPAQALAGVEERLRGLPADDPRMADMGALRAAYTVLTGQVDAGLKLYRELAEGRPLDLRQHGMLAYALLRQGRSAEAEAALAAAGRGQPEEEKRAYLSVAALLEEAGQKEQGLALAERLLERYPDDRELYLQLARAHLREEDQAQASRVLERALKLFPDDAEVRFQLGASYERQKRWEEAERELEAVIASAPGHAMALNYLAYMLAERNEKLDQALKYARRAVAIDGDSGAYLDTLGWALFKLGELGEARQRLSEAVERVPDDAVVHEHLGDVLAKAGDEAGARKAYQRALELAAPEVQPGLRGKLDKLKPAAPAGKTGG